MSAQYYRERAASCHLTAEQFTEPAHRVKLLEMAEAFMRLAHRFERLEQGVCFDIAGTRKSSFP